MQWFVVPVRKPRIGQEARGIDFLDFSVMVEIVAGRWSFSSLGERPPFAAGGLHFPTHDLEAIIRAPLHCLPAIDQCLEDALRWSGDFDFADD